jgi:hypothetical protein
MAEDTGTTTPPEGTDDAAKPEDDKRVPYERFEAVNTKAKDAALAVTALEKQVATLTAAQEARESEGLPDLERERKAREKAEQRLEESERKAEQIEARAARSQKERWVSAAAARLNFADPEDATRYIDLDSVEDADQAEREVKRIAKAKTYLVKPDEQQRPQVGRVLEGGRAATKPTQKGIDGTVEAEMLASELSKFANKWATV